MAIQIRRGNDSEWESNKSNIVAGEPAVTLDSERMFVGTGSGTYMELANLDVLADAFDSSASYEVGDFVAYHGKVYKCNTAHSGAWNASDFDEVALADALDSLGEDVYTKAEADALLALKANASDVNSALALKADKTTTYTKTEVDSALALKADKSDTYTKTEVNTTLEDYAKVDGYYESMTVGNAEQLVTNLTDTESEPFTFRTSGGNLEIGDREELKVIGGSVVWNQLVTGAIPATKTENGVTCTNNGDGTYTISGTAEASTFFKVISEKTWPSHKYLMIGAPSGSSNSTYSLRIRGAAYDIVDTGNGCIWDGGVYKAIVIAAWSGTVIDTPVTFRPQYFDLTQMFGTTIADYIYNLEQSTAGAGVAFFKKYFPKDYYPYNEGEMLHVQTSEFKTVGFNAWDEEWVNGYRGSSTGVIVPNASNITNKNLIPVLPNTTYFWRVGINGRNNVMFYDANQELIGKSWLDFNNPFTTPTNCAYIAFTVGVSTYNHDICISLHWDGTRDGEYEPYNEHSYPLDDSLTLRGIPKLDANNNLYYDGDTYEHDGTVTRKYGIVDLGTLTWGKNWDTGDPTGVFYSQTLDYLNVDGYAINKNYIFRKGVNPNTMDDKSITLFGTNRIYIKDTAYTDGTTFKTALSGVYLVYELATPTTETADTFTNPQIVDNWGTEEFVVPTQSGVEIPVGHETVYPISLRDKLESAPNLPDGDGDYLLHMASGEATYKQLVSEFPSAPTTDGTYVLKATVTDGTATLSWEAQA